MTTERQKEKLRQKEWDAYRAAVKSAGDAYDAAEKPVWDNFATAMKSAGDKRDRRLKKIEAKK